MSAGAIRAPLIIPLRAPMENVPKSHIDSNTRLEIMSETPNVNIYFTINGNRPTVSKNEKELLSTGTYKFHCPFTLPPGTQTVRAIAHSPDTGSESSVVTKTFDVSKSKKSRNNGLENDDYRFLKDLKLIESCRRQRLSELNKPVKQDLIRQMLAHERGNQKQSRISKTRSSDKNIQSPPTTASKAVQVSRIVNCIVPQVESVSTETDAGSLTLQRKTNELRSETSDQSEHRPFDPSIRPSTVVSVPNPTIPLARLQRLTDVLHCPYCFHVRSTNPPDHFCGHCGQPLPSLPVRTQPEPVLDQLGMCQTCGSSVPLNLSTCLVCEQSLNRSAKTTPSRMIDFRVCTTCLTPNPVTVNSCLTCEARLPVSVTRFSSPNTTGLGKITPPVPIPPVAFPPSVVNQTGETKSPVPVSFVPCVHCRRQNNPDARYCDWCGLETQGKPTDESSRVPAWLPSTPVKKSEESSQYSVPHALDRRGVLVVPCLRCGTLTDRNSKFCCACGSPIEPPPRHAFWTEQLQTFALGPANSPFCPPDWKPSSPKKLTPQVIVANVATQTIGLFYPSSADLRRQPSLVRCTPGLDTQLRDRVPLLTPVSPGRGYWRKQLDHIIAHFKVYTNNNPGFRSVISEPRLGKLLTADFTESRRHATVLLTFTLPDSVYSKPLEESSDYDLNIDCSAHRPEREATFMSRASKPGTKLPKSRRHCVSGDENPDATPEICQNRAESGIVDVDSDNHNVGCQALRTNKLRHRSVSQSEDVSSGSITISPSDETGSVEANKKLRVRDRKISSARSGRVTRSRIKSADRNGKTLADGVQHGEAGVALQRDSKLTASDRSLLHLLSLSDSPSDDAIIRLVAEGANPNCVTANGETPLVLAVHNRHEQAIATLINAGSKPNAPGTLTGNTALHEAVLLGCDGVQMATILLKHGANPKCKNRRQESSHELVQRMKCEPLTNLFVTYMGQMQLEQLNKQPTPSPVNLPEKDAF